MDALRLLADRPESSCTMTPTPSGRKTQELSPPWTSGTCTTSACQRSRRPNRPASYLKSRGIGGDIARQFKLGWASGRVGRLAKGSSSREVLMDTVGVRQQGDRRQTPLQRASSSRFFDPGGKAIAVGGRILPPPYGVSRPMAASRRIQELTETSSTPSVARSMRSTGPRTTSSSPTRSSSVRLHRRHRVLMAGLPRAWRRAHGPWRRSLQDHANSPNVSCSPTTPQGRSERGRVGLPVGINRS